MIELLASGATVLTVGELTAYVRSLLLDSPLQDLWVRGEVSNASMSRAGHLFFSLKDETALVKCVAWAPISYRLRQSVVDGQEVVAHGRLDLYAPQGVYQLYVDRVVPVGLGLAYLEFERVKRLLEEEGLFRAERKRPLPRYPARIGVVTSAQSAARRDIENVISRRWPAVELVLAHASVQGDSAPAEVVRALEALYAAGVDVVIVARGGGAQEDLSCFNDERVARTIAASPVPVVSGVGHETDFTIADFVADVRAPTPSAAAAAVVPDREEVTAEVSGLRRRMLAAAVRAIESRRASTAAAGRSLWRASPQYRLAMSEQALELATGRLVRAQEARLATRRQAISALAVRLRLAEPVLNERRAGVVAAAARLEVAMTGCSASLRSRLQAQEARLAALDPSATLARGYALIRRRDLFATVVTSAKSLEKGAPIDIQFADGTVPADVVGPAKLGSGAKLSAPWDEGGHSQ